MYKTNWRIKNNMIVELHNGVDYVNGESNSSDWKLVLAEGCSINPMCKLEYDSQYLMIPETIDCSFIFRDSDGWPILSVGPQQDNKRILLTDIFIGNIIHNSNKLIELKKVDTLHPDLRKPTPIQRQRSGATNIAEPMTTDKLTVYILDGIIEVHRPNGFHFNEATIQFGETKHIIPNAPSIYKYFIQGESAVTVHNVPDEFFVIHRTNAK